MQLNTANFTTAEALVKELRVLLEEIPETDLLIIHVAAGGEHVEEIKDLLNQDELQRVEFSWRN